MIENTVSSEIVLNKPKKILKRVTGEGKCLLGGEHSSQPVTPCVS